MGNFDLDEKIVKKAADFAKNEVRCPVHRTMCTYKISTKRGGIKLIWDFCCSSLEQEVEAIFEAAVIKYRDEEMRNLPKVFDAAFRRGFRR